MSTRSTIAVQLPNGKIKAAYCHFDGYPDCVGRALVNFYKTAKAASALVKQGDIRTLNSETGRAAFYHEPAEVFDNFAAWRAHVGESCYDYSYFFDPLSKSWICQRGDDIVCLLEYHNRPPVKTKPRGGRLAFANA